MDYAVEVHVSGKGQISPPDALSIPVTVGSWPRPEEQVGGRTIQRNQPCLLPGSLFTRFSIESVVNMTTGQDGGRRLLKQGGLRPDLLPVEGAAGGHALRGRQQGPPAAPDALAAPDAAVTAAPDAAAD